MGCEASKGKHTHTQEHGERQAQMRTSAVAFRACPKHEDEGEGRKVCRSPRLSCSRSTAGAPSLHPRTGQSHLSSFP